jgi:regulator of ribonuclease activity A
LDASTCDLSDEHGERGRVVAPVFRHFGGRRRFKGEVVTIKCFEDNSRLKEMVETPGAGRVIVVDGGGSLRYALLGDMLAKKAVARGWAGIVVDGCVRDTAELGTLDLGVLARAAFPRRSSKNGEGRINVPIELAGTPCAPGDMLFADEDGIFLIDPALLTTTC